MNDSKRTKLDRTRLFAITYYTAAFSMSALLLFWNSLHSNRDDLLYDFILPTCLALLLIGGFADGTSARLRKHIVFRVAVVTLFFCLFTQMLPPAVH